MCLQHEPSTPIKQLIFITNKVSYTFRAHVLLCVCHITRAFGKLGIGESLNKPLVVAISIKWCLFDENYQTTKLKQLRNITATYICGIAHGGKH